MDASSETDRDNVLPVPDATEGLSTIPGRLRNSVSLDEMLGSDLGGNDSDSGAAAASVAAGDGSRREGIGTRGVARHHSIHRTLLSEAAAPLPALVVGEGMNSQLLEDSPSASQFGALAGGSHSSNSDIDNGVDKLDLSPKLNDRECHERAEWQHMLTIALTGQVVDSEKKRLNTLADSSLFNLTDNEYAEHLSDLLQSRDFSQQFRNIHTELWLGCRAAIRGRTPLQEKQTLESLRALYTDSTLRAVMDFSADRVVSAGSAVATTGGDGEALPAEFSTQCLIQLQRLLRWVDYVEGLYPTLRALSEAKPIYASQPFQGKLAAIISWTNISVRLGLLHTMIQRWTGSRELSLYSTASLELYASTTAGITKDGVAGSSGEQGTASEATHYVRSLSSKGYQHTPFVERLLKENGMKMIFEQKILTELEKVVQSARCDLMENSVLLAEMGLPVINRHMQELLRFPPRLLQTCLLIRLQSAENLNNPTMVQVDQLLDDIRDSLSVACRVKRTFNSLAGPANSWNPGVQLDPEYDRTLRSCLQMFFRLLHRKLNISNDVVGGTKVFEVLENQWPFLLEVVRDIEGGQFELALRYCQQSRFVVQTWTRILARLLQGPPAYDSMNSREFSKWFSSVSQAIRSPILRGQRLMRTIQNAVANSTDYEFDDPFPLLALLVDSKHVLVYTSGEWESRGVYIIGSQALQQKPHLARELLDSCIIDDVLAKDQYRDCYLLAIRTDAEFNWTGASVVPQGRPIQYQDLELCPGQMRLISPGVDRLEGHRKWLERINIATELQGWETATAVSDAIIEDWIKCRSARHSSSGEGAHGKRLRPSSTSGVGDLRRMAASAAGTDGGGRAHSDASVVCRGPRATSSQGDDDEADEFDEARSDYAALRPSLEPYDRRLARINAPSPGAARDAGGKAKPHAAARVRELVRAHNPAVQREWSLLKYSIMRLMDALTQVPDMLRMLHLVFHERRAFEAGFGAALSSPQAADTGGQQSAAEVACRGDSCELVEQVQESFSFVSNTAARTTRLLDLKAERYIRLALLHMCVGWCGFITEDCMANEKRTFSWAVQALEYTMRASKHNTVKVLPPDEWQVLKSQVAGCLTLMIGHFDILGARNEESLNNELQKERDQALRHMDDPNALLSLDGIGANFRTQQMQKQRVQHSQQVDHYRDRYLHDSSRIGRVLEVTARPEDQTLRLLAASPSNINIRWQIGRNIGGGAFGSVYIGYNLDTGEMMAVKEIRFPSRPLERAPAGLGHGMRAGGEVGRDHPGHKIAREMKVMSMLQHPNIVTYYGFEVHREKVYLFMELCSKGSLAQVIRDQGRIEEDAAKIFVVQILRGLKYLHDNDICHRDIKCDNTLLDESMNIKLVDFGAAKVLNRQSLAATRRTRMGEDNGVSLTGTPMYMAPEVIQGGSTTSGGDVSAVTRPGKLGAQDIWSLGCCIVEMITGKPPWAHLDNEWAIMYQVVQGNPRLPDAADISSDGMQFIKRCFARHPADRPRAEELLKDRWVASTVRHMERLEARGQTSGRLAASGNSEFLVNLDFNPYSRAIGEDDSEVGDTAATRSTDRNEQRHRHKHSISSVGSMGSVSGANNLASRSRATSINRKHVPGDLRFITSATGGPSGEAMLSMMEREKVVSSGATDVLASSTSDRSPGGLPNASFLPGNAALSLSPPVGNTPGSPSSATSMHAAWPFNKDATVSSTRSSKAHAAFRNSIGGDSGGAKMALATPEILGSAGEDLVARYSSPSLIYQVLNSNAAASSSTSRTGSVSSPLAQLSSSLPTTSVCHSAGMMESPVEPTASGSVSQFDVVGRGQSQRSGSFAAVGTGESGRLFGAGGEDSQDSAGHLSNDEIQDLSETTRMAVAAMLSMPLEGADVAGVSGWLGEGFTPMEMLGAEEVKEALATTSHIVVREREQQLRRQQEIRHLLHRQQPLNTPLRQADGESMAVSPPSVASDSRLTLGPSNLQSMCSVGPQSDSGVTRFSGLDGTLRSEPPALYPLPSDEETN